MELWKDLLWSKRNNSNPMMMTKQEKKSGRLKAFTP